VAQRVLTQQLVHDRKTQLTRVIALPVHTLSLSQRLPLTHLSYAVHRSVDGVVIELEVTEMLAMEASTQ